MLFCVLCRLFLFSAAHFVTVAYGPTHLVSSIFRYLFNVYFWHLILYSNTAPLCIMYVLSIMCIVETGTTFTQTRQCWCYEFGLLSNILISAYCNHFQYHGCSRYFLPVTCQNYKYCRLVATVVCLKLNLSVHHTN